MKEPHRARLKRNAGRRLRILLAEDNRINQQYATLILANAGHDVQVAANGREAVALMGDCEFDLVLMDIQMPEVDGEEAARRIRALEPPKCRLPIIAVTAHAMAGSREKYLALGMDGYIAKPYQPKQLLKLIADTVENNAAANRADSDSESGAASATLPDLDAAQLATLGSVFSLEQIRGLASLYLIDIEARRKLIAECRASNNFEGISRQAHMIVSMAGNLGLKQTSATAHRLELACLEHGRAGVSELVDALTAACDASSQALRAWLDGAPLSIARRESGP